MFLAVVLAGYLFFGRPFAYLHVPAIPVFLGELLLGVGLVVVLRRSHHLVRTVSRSPPLEALLLLLGLGTARLVADLPSYGLLALRDAALWYYALLAFVVAALLTLNPSLLDRLLSWYARILPWFLVWGGVAVIVSRQLTNGPTVPGTGVPVFGFKAGDLAVHLAIGLSFFWLLKGEETLPARRLRLLVTGAGLMSLLIAGTTNRGGFVSAAFILGGTALASPARRRTMVSTVAGVLLLLLALAALSDARLDVDGREISLRQLAENVSTLVGAEGSEKGAQRGTVQWRLAYWGDIAQDTLAGNNGPLGLGFGPNLADTYGYQVAFDEPLRNAHNSHVTLLARLGLPGFAVWLLFWLVWFRTLASKRRKASPESRERHLSSWLTISVLGILVNAAFDPGLEGPQVALWLWTLVGIGCSGDWTTETSSRASGARAAWARNGRISPI
ncbi:MAG TPA: O-antigen ligase family protein [Egibacteraceae bacterium]|nr:O-antigen ligase family protein [Egibacteraceae bacterium]